MLETGSQQEDKVEMTNGLSQRQRQRPWLWTKGVENNHGKSKVKERWKGVDTFFDRLNKEGCVTGFPFGTLIVCLFFDQSEKVCHLTGNRP